MLLIVILTNSSVLEAQPGPGGTTGQARPQTPPDRAFLGAYTELNDKTNPKSGLHVTYFYPHSTAAAIGLRVDDEIVALNDFLIRTREQFVAELRNNNVGGTIRFLVRRTENGEKKKVKLKGKIKGYRKTMNLVQEELRKKIVGKALPKTGETLVWDPKATKFAKEADPLAHLKGKIGLVIWYDDCKYCLSKRYDFLAKLHLRSVAAGQGLPLEYAGLFYSDREREKSTKANIDAATKLYTTKRPAFQAGVIDLKTLPLPAERHDALYVFNHGVAVLDPEGKVAYLQIFGGPDEASIQRSIAQLYVKHFQKPGGKPKAGGSGGGPEKK